MATLVQLSGKPASGKTSGARFLAPTSTIIIDADKKGLPWAGWKKDYNKESKNYFPTSDITDIVKVLNFANSKPEIKYVLIDTINSIMTDKEVADSKRPSFDKWKDMAVDIYELYDMIRSDLRDDLIVFTMAHIEAYEVDGETNWRTKFNGKYATKLNLNSKLNYNLYAFVDRTNEEQGVYSLITQSNGKNEARSPMDVLPYKMENNLLSVVTAIASSES